MTRKQLVVRGNRICARLNARAGSVKVRTLQDVASTAPELAGYYRTAFAELRRLSPPASLARDWRAVVTDIQTLAGDVLAMGKYAGDNDPRFTAKVSSEIGELQRRRIAAARRIGLEDCAQI